MELFAAGAAAEQIEDRSQPALHVRQPLPRVAANQLIYHRHVGSHRPGLFLQLPPRSRQGEAFDQQQVLDAPDLLEQVFLALPLQGREQACGRWVPLRLTM